MRVGLDFGTTNSSAAVYDGTRVRLLDLDPINNAPTIMRSTLFMTRDGVPFIGREAIDRFTEVVMTADGDGGDLGLPKLRKQVRDVVERHFAAAVSNT